MAFSDAKQFKLGTPVAAVTFREAAGTTVHAHGAQDPEKHHLHGGEINGNQRLAKANGVCEGHIEVRSRTAWHVVLQ